MNSKKTIFFTLALAVAIGFSCWLALNIAKNLLHESNVSTQNPDFFMHNVIYTQMDEDGNMRNQITAPSLVHYLDNDTSMFEKPHLLVFNVTQKLWDISADRGKSISFMGTIYLSDNVNIERMETPNDLGFTVKTTAMTVYPDSKTANTKEPVTILQNGSVVNAVGATADLAQGTVNLLSKVEGNYAPEKTTNNEK